MNSLVELTALEARIPGGIPSSETDRAQAALDDAAALVEAYAAQDDEDKWDSNTVPMSVVTVVCAVAMRALHNPYGMQSETMGGYTWRKDAEASGSALYLTEGEKKLVRREAGTSTPIISIETKLHYGFYEPDTYFLGG